MDITVEKRRLNTIKRMIASPTIEAVMILPEKVFIDYKFDRFIYIKNKDFQGYFFITKIDNYKNGSTPVRVDLLYID
jgi:hypothetical protein